MFAITLNIDPEKLKDTGTDKVKDKKRTSKAKKAHAQKKASKAKTDNS